MPIVAKCNSCGKKFKAPDRAAGKRVRCKCGKPMRVPQRKQSLALTDSVTDLGDLAALAEGESIHEARCPSCKTHMEDDAIICVKCGFNKQTGAQMVMAASPPPEPVGDPVPATKKSKKSGSAKRNKEPSALPGQLIKLVVFLVFFGGFAYVTYHLVQAATFDPVAQMKADKLKISPRMSVYQVVDAMGKPPKEILAPRDPDESDEVVKNVPKKLFWSSDFMKKYGEKEAQWGFQMIYKYTTRDWLVFWFDGDGVLVSMDDEDPQSLIWGN